MQRCFTEEEISRYLDGELDPREARLIEEHLESCPGCKALARRIEDTGIALKAYWQKAVAPSLTRGTACPDEGILIAFADGSIRGEEERREIAAHLAGCDYCGRIVAEASRASDLVNKVEKEKPARVPAHLDRLLKERYFPSPPVSLGRINVSLSEIWKAFPRFLNPPYPIAPSFQRMAMVAEEPEVFPARPAPELSFAGEEPRKRETSREIRKPSRAAKPRPDEKTRQRAASLQPTAGKKRPLRGLRWTFERGEMNVAVEMAGSGMKDVECRINLTDCYGFPLAGVPLRLEKDGKKVWSHLTELNKEAVFPHVICGRYRLTIDHDRDYHLDLDVR